MGTTHVAFALLCYYVIAYSVGLSFDAPVVLTLLVVGSLLPDIDHPRAFLTRQLCLFKQASRGIGRYVTHRGIVHSLSAALIATIAVWAVALFYDLKTLAVSCFFLGFVSHLAADSLNPTGIKWLQPFSNAELRDGIRTCSAVEKLFFFFVIAAISVILYVSDMFPEVGSIWLWHII